MKSVTIHGYDVQCPAGMDENVFKGIMQEDMTRVRLHLKDKDQVPMSYLERMEVEWKKYLVAVFMGNGAALAISAPVDHFAHAHMLFTKAYRDFCGKVLGYFIDHLPTVNQAERDDLKPSFRERTVPFMKSLFGAENVDEEVWNEGEVICQYCGNTVSDPVPA